MPTTIVLFSGYILYRKNILTDVFLDQGDKLCFSFLIPILVFYNIYQGKQYEISYAQYRKVILFAYGVVLSSAIVGMLLIPRLIKIKEKIPVVIQSMYRGNFMLYGLPFSQQLGGNECLMLATAMTAATLPILNIIAIFQFSYYTEGDKNVWRTAIFKTLKNPILLGIMLGFLFQKADWNLTQSLEMVVSDLAKTATPLAFLLLGGRFRWRSWQKNRRLLGVILLSKLCVLPIIYLPICYFVLHMNRVELIPVFIFLAAPSAVTTYQLAGQYGADVKLAGDVVIYSLLFSTITIFLLTFFLKTLGWI